METDQSLEDLPATASREVRVEINTEPPGRTSKKPRYRPKVAAVVAEEPAKSPVVEVEQSVGGWQNLAVTITALVVGVILALLLAVLVAAALSNQVDAAAVFGAFSVRFLS